MHEFDELLLLLLLLLLQNGAVEALRKVKVLAGTGLASFFFPGPLVIR
jgi:hypothetical protein